MADRLTGLEVLVAIVDSGGFARAARRLAMSPTMVSTHLARLEDRLGTRLIHRSTRRFALTTEGHMLVEEARAILTMLDQAENAVRRGGVGPRGRVSLDVPGAIGLRFVTPALPRFRAARPHIALHVNASERATLVTPEGFDMLIRVGLTPETRGETIILGRTRFVQLASPDYLRRRGAPATPEDLHEHDAVIYATPERPVGQWRFSRDGERRSLRVDGVATFNHGDAIATAAAAGVGIAQTLEVLVRDELAAGTLVPVLADWNREPVDIQLFIPHDRAHRPAVRAVADFLRADIDWGEPL